MYTPRWAVVRMSGPAGAEASNLTIIVGGRPTAYEHTLPILRTFGETSACAALRAPGQAVKPGEPPIGRHPHRRECRGRRVGHEARC